MIVTSLAVLIFPLLMAFAASSDLLTTLWIGFGEMLPYLVYAALLGGALTLGVLAIRRWPLPALLARIAWIDRLHDAKSGVPYGIALAISGILVYSDTTIFQHLVA